MSQTDRQTDSQTDRQTERQKKQAGPLLYLILYGFVSFLDLFLQSIDVFLQRLDHSLQFVVLVLLPLYFSFVIVDLLLQACKLTRKKKSSKTQFRLHFKHLKNYSVLSQQLSTGQLALLKHPWSLISYKWVFILRNTWCRILNDFLRSVFEDMN